MTRISFVSLVLAFLCGLVPHPSFGVPSPKEKWLRVRTPHFTLLSDAHPEVTTEAAQMLECFRGTVEEQEPTTATGVYVPTTVILFEDEDAFRPYKLQPSGDPLPYAGFFVPTPDGNYIGMTMSEERDPYATVLHEYTHWMLEKNHAQVPLWLHEGMAEFYSTFKIKGDKAVIGRTLEYHLEWLDHLNLIPLPKLFVMDHASRDWNEGLRRGLFYAQAWILYHYMHLGRPELAPKLDHFLRSLNATANTTTAWNEAFGTGYEPIEAGLRQYVQDKRFPTREVPLRCPDRDALGDVSQVPYADVAYILGDFMAHATPWQTQETRSHFEAALRADPTHARAQVALATLLDAEDHRLEAADLFHKAQALAGNDDEVYFRWGSSKVRRAQVQYAEATMPLDTLPADLLTARDLLKRSLALRPERAEALVNLGVTYIFDPGDAHDGVVALESARALLPARMDVACYLVYLYLRAENRAAATSLVHDVLGRSLSREWLQRATSLLEEDNVRLYNSAVDRVRDGDDAGALRLLDQLAVGVDDASFARTVATLREQLLSRSRNSH